MSTPKSFLLAGVIGCPVSHSLSPRLHGYWLREHGIEGAYLPLKVSSRDLEAALRGLPFLGFSGVNITVPHKERALQLCDEVDGAAEGVGAVNMVTVTKSGRLVGSNTDGVGFLTNLDQEGGGHATEGRAVVLGAGGAARAVVSALIERGVAEVLVCNRTYSRSEALADAFGVRCIPTHWEEREAKLEFASLLVNTTSLGMKGKPSLKLKLDALPKDAVVSDIVYSPLETRLLAVARARGNKVVDGLGMLLHQGRPAFGCWFGLTPEVTGDLRRYVEKALAL